MRKRYLYIIILSLLFTSAITFSVRFFKPVGSNKIENTESEEFKNKTLPIIKGKTPYDLDALRNLYTAMGVFEKRKYYQFKGVGEVIAEPKLVSTRRQPIYERASYYNGEFVLEGISPSNIKVAEVVSHRYENSSKGVFLVYKGTSDADGKNTTWPKEPKRYSKEEFHKKYGIRRVAPTPYIINDHTASIENTTQTRLGNGNLKITTVLDPIKSAELFKRTIATQGNAKNHPVFKKVKLEFEIDKDWNVVKTNTYVEYYIDTYGGADCQSSISHTFEYKNEPVFDRNMYEKYFDSKIDDKEEDKTPSAIELLTEVFAPYLLKGFNFEIFKNDTLLNLSLYFNNGGINLSGESKLLNTSFLYDGKNLFINKNGKGYVYEISSLIELLKLFNIDFNLNQSDLINKLSSMMSVSVVDGVYNVEIKYLGFKVVIKIDESKKLKEIKLYNTYDNLKGLNDVDIKLTDKKYEFTKLDNYDKTTSNLISYFKSLLENKEYKEKIEKSYLFDFKYENIKLAGKLKLVVDNNELKFYLNSVLNDKKLKLAYENGYLYLEYDENSLKLNKADIKNIIAKILEISDDKKLSDIFKNILNGNFKEIFKSLNLASLDIESIIKTLILDKEFIGYTKDDLTFKFLYEGVISLLKDKVSFTFKGINNSEFEEFTLKDAKVIESKLVNSLLDLLSNFKELIKTKELVLENFAFEYDKYKFNGEIKLNLKDKSFYLSGVLKYNNITTKVELTVLDKIVYLKLFEKLNVKFSLSEISEFNEILEKVGFDLSKFEQRGIIKYILSFIQSDKFNAIYEKLNKAVNNSTIKFSGAKIDIDGSNYLDVKNIKGVLNNLVDEYLNIKNDRVIEKTLNLYVKYFKNNTAHEINADAYLYFSKNTLDVSLVGTYKSGSTEISFKLRYDGFNLFVEYDNKKLSLSRELLFSVVDKYIPKDYGKLFDEFYNALKENKLYDFIKNIALDDQGYNLDELFNEFSLTSSNLLMALKDKLDINLLFDEIIKKLIVKKILENSTIDIEIKKSTLNKSDIILSIDNAKEVKKEFVDNVLYLLEKLTKVYDSGKLKIEDFKYQSENLNFNGRLLFDLNNKKISLVAKFIVNKVKFNAEIVYENNHFYINMLNDLRTYLNLDELGKVSEILSLMNMNFLKDFDLKGYLNTFDILSAISNVESVKNLLGGTFDSLYSGDNLYKIFADIVDIFKKSSISYDFNENISVDSNLYTNLLTQAEFVKNIINSYKEKNLDKFLDDKYLLEGSVFNEKTLKEEINFNIRLSKSNDNNLRKVMFDLVLNDLVRDQVHKATIYYEDGLFYLIYNNLTTKIKPAPLKHLISRILEIIGINNDLLFKLLEVESSGIESVIKDKIFSGTNKEVDLDEICYKGFIKENELGVNLVKKIFEEFNPTYDLISKLVHENGKLKEFVLNNLYVSENRRFDLKLLKSNHSLEAGISDERKNAAIDLVNLEKIADAFIKTQATRKYHLVATGANKEINLNIGGIASGIKFQQITKDGKVNMHAHYYHDSWLSGTVTKNYMNTHDLYIKDGKMFLKRKFAYTWISSWKYETYTSSDLEKKTKDDLIATLFSFGPSVQRAIKNNLDGSSSDPNYTKKIPPLDAILDGYKSNSETNYDINFNLKAITSNNNLDILKTNLTINNGYLHKIKFDTTLSVLNVSGEFELVQDNDSWEIEYPSDFS